MDIVPGAVQLPVEERKGVGRKTDTSSSGLFLFLEVNHVLTGPF